ncbi:MAG: hypothetical protein PHY88_03080 [Candidatus Omnitrophica bacterium]|nr:hypothetical protein [Candidatus Omnitrophota bacterium]
MNRIFILLGGSNSGKSSVLRSLKDRVTVKYIFIKFSSFQEIVEFCKYKEVIKKLKKYINKCTRKANNENMLNFVIVIAFALRRNRNRGLGVKCITEPLRFLRSLPNFKIHIIHLCRNIPRLQEVDNYIANNFKSKLTLKSVKPSRRRQGGNAEKLKTYISHVINNR